MSRAHDVGRCGFYPKVDRATVILPQQSWLELGCVSAVDCNGRTIWIADAHRDDGKHFIVRADEKPSAFLELESAIQSHKTEYGAASV